MACLPRLDVLKGSKFNATVWATASLICWLSGCAEASQPLYIQAENSKLQTNGYSPLSLLSTRCGI